jgi:hypothetical protein
MPADQGVDLVHRTRRTPLETRRQKGSGCSTVNRSLSVLEAESQSVVGTHLRRRFRPVIGSYRLSRGRNWRSVMGRADSACLASLPQVAERLVAPSCAGTCWPARASNHPRASPRDACSAQRARARLRLLSGALTRAPLFRPAPGRFACARTACCAKRANACARLTMRRLEGGRPRHDHLSGAGRLIDTLTNADEPVVGIEPERPLVVRVDGDVKRVPQGL